VFALKVNVVCSRGKSTACYTQDANCEIVTFVECIAADGGVICPRNFYKGRNHLLGWHAGVQEKHQPTCAWSTRGNTDNELGLE
jgi:hypothetical protein